jgi:predicted dithiol-disulfide oxidoreductase (DUF899 family)
MKRFPNESIEYRQARSRLLQAEIDLRTKIEQVARERRQLPKGGLVKEDYTFEGIMPDGAVKSIRLSELFSPGKDSVIIYSFMYGPKMEKPCPSCTSLIDGFNVTAPHTTQRVNMVIVAKSPIERIMTFARSRGWDKIRLLSSYQNTYNRDYLAEGEDGSQLPMINVFVKSDSSVHHSWGSELLYAEAEGDPRHVDLVWPLWNLLDLTPEGRGTDWNPKLSY